MKSVLKKRISYILVTALLSLSLIFYTQTSAVSFAQSNIQQVDKEYLSTYFGISSFGSSVTEDEFTEALSKVGSMKKAEGAKVVSGVDALKLSVRAANFEELAGTYSSKKAAKNIASYNITGAPSEEYLSIIACALDTGLIDAAMAQQLIKSQSITDNQALSLVMSVAQVNGKTRNLLGYSNNPDIYRKLNNAWESFIIFEDDKLADIGTKAVQDKVTTGFSIRKNSYDANFLPELTLRYGHSDIKHAVQLIGLLNSEGIVARVQLEPKTSVYQYLLDWGPVPEATPTYEVKKIKDDLYLAYATEYDLMLEFENLNDKRAFNSIIMQYSKKSDKNPKGEGMLYGAWWQPLYSSSEEMYGEYELIYDNVITSGGYSLHSFCLPKDKDTVLEKLKTIDKSVKVEQTKNWCNTAFYRYLSGDYQ